MTQHDDKLTDHDEKIAEIHKAIYGNGSPETGIMWRLTQIEDTFKAIKRVTTPLVLAVLLFIANQSWNLVVRVQSATTLVEEKYEIADTTMGPFQTAK